MTIFNPYFDQYGGAFIPETLVGPLQEIEKGFIEIQNDKNFQQELSSLLRDFAGRPTPLYLAKNLSDLAEVPIYLKREDLLHGGAHKTNNALGQGLLAKYLGKKRIIAETGAGQHGVATALIGALLKLPVTIFMGAEDVKRQAPNVQRMKLFGAEVISVTSGTATLKDAVNEALKNWIAHAEDTYYIFGTAAGPHPFPHLVRYFQKIIGEEARAQMLAQVGQLPEALFACIGGGSNAIGIFSAFLNDPVKIYGAEAAGLGLHTQQHAASLIGGRPGIFHGMYSYFLQDQQGQIAETHSISAGLDYPGIGPEHAALHDAKRVTYMGVTDEEALAMFKLLAREEGILGALESCHALALAFKLSQQKLFQGPILVNLSGRGDKDLTMVERYLS